MLKVDSKGFADLLKKFKMSDSQEIQECIFEFSDDKVSAYAFAISKISVSEIIIKKEFFIEYENIGRLPLSNINDIIALVKRFKGEIELIKTENTLIIKNKEKQVEIELTAEEYINQDKERMKLEYNFSYTMKESEFKNLIEDIGFLPKDYNIIFELNDGKLIIKNTGKYKFKREYEAGHMSNFFSKFNNSLLDAIKNMSGDIEFFIGDNYPIKIIEKNALYEIIIISAPLGD